MWFLINVPPWYACLITLSSFKLFSKKGPSLGWDFLISESNLDNCADCEYTKNDEGTGCIIILIFYHVGNSFMYSCWSVAYFLWLSISNNRSAFHWIAALKFVVPKWLLPASASLMSSSVQLPSRNFQMRSKIPKDKFKPGIQT